MHAPIFVRELSEQERAQLESALRAASAFTMRRAQTVLASAAGRRPREIARDLRCAVQTVRNAVRAFNATGVASLTAASSRPRSAAPVLGGAEREGLRAILHQSPRTFGRARSTWTLDLLARVKHQQGLSPAVLSGETISQPFVAAVVTDLLDPRPHKAVLEVGTGPGYQAAVLAGLARRVWTVEVVEEFAAAAEALFRQLGLANVGVRVGDGSRGWAERAPFDKIIVTAATREVPPALLEQLRPGGRMVLPAGDAEAQRLAVVDKGADGRVGLRELMDVRFAPLETA